MLKHACAEEVNLLTCKLFSISKSGDHWLGARYRYGVGLWEWTNGSCEWGFEDWGGRYTGGDYRFTGLLIGYQWGWNDAGSMNPRRFICQFN